MDIVKHLNPRFKIAAYEPGASEESIAELQKHSRITVPEDYINLIRQMTDPEILITDNDYIRIWPPISCIEFDEDFDLQKRIPRSLVIGDDEGDMVLILMTGSSGFGLYIVEKGALATDEVKYVAASLTELLVNGVGVSNIF